MTTTTRATATLAVVLGLGACTHDGATTNVAAAGAERPRITSPAVAELLAGVPATAAAIGFLDLPESPWSQITRGWPLPLGDEARRSLDAELREHMLRFLGLDLSKLQYAVGFAAGPPASIAILMKGVGGSLKAPPTGEYAGTKVWLVDPEEQILLALRGDVMLVGDEAAVRGALDTLTGKRTSAVQDHRELVELLRKDSAGAVLAFAAIRPRMLQLPPPIGGVDRVALSLRGRGFAAAVDGDDAAITRLQATAAQAFAAMRAQVEKTRAAALAGEANPVEGAIAIVAAAYGKDLAARLAPRRSGNHLSTSLDFGTDVSATSLPIVGILTAVAIPAFMDYMKRSKKTEAAVQLSRIRRSAKRAYEETGKYPAGATPLMPSRSCCDYPARRCPAIPERYAADPVWAALDFEISEPTLFQYSYRGSPDGQSFIAKAIGDLDCDGIFITYELTGSASGIVLTEPPPNAD